MQRSPHIADHVMAAFRAFDLFESSVKGSKLGIAGQVNQVEVESLEIRGHSGLALSTAVKLSSELQLGQ